jgi:cytochrome bd-type quinol oxidase subunit 2
MIFLSIIAWFVHITAVVILLSTVPRQLHDILHEKDVRYRKICWLILLGTMCLISVNTLPLLEPFFYEQVRELAFNTVTSIFNAIITIMLGILAHLMYKSSKETLPKTVDDLDTRIKNGKK